MKTTTQDQQHMQTQDMNISYEEKDVMDDLLTSLKKLTSDYNTFASEVAHNNLKQDVMNILREEHEAESMLFEEMNSRGWYTTKTASPQDIKKARNNFSKLDKQYNL